MENEEVLAVVGTTPQAEGEAELTRTVTAIEMQADDIVIASQADYQAAAELGRLIKQRSSQVTDFWAPLKKAAHDAHKQVCDREKQMLTPLVNAEKIIKQRMGAWHMEQERIREAEEERLRRAAQEEAERKLAEAVVADENGDAAAAEAALADASVIDQASRGITVSMDAPKAHGVSAGVDWEIVSVDSKSVPLKLNEVELRPVDTKAVMRLIRASKGQINIPGIVYKAVPKMSFRK